jgi:outer membrane cobalamin receptor
MVGRLSPRLAALAGLGLAIGLLAGGAGANAESADQAEPSKPIDQMSIEELMQVKIEVGSAKPTTVNNTTAIVTLITSDEIARMGARDLIDVLILVPGLSFGSDIFGIVGIGVRGLWAHEAKALLLIDGFEFNEAMFGTTQFGRHFPINLIDRIEIIRGPGSVVYGGSAELAVIKITTKLAALRGGEVIATSGRQVAGSPENIVEAGIGHSSDSISAGAIGMVGQANRSDRDYADSKGSTYNLDGHAALNDTFFEARIAGKSFSAQLVYDDYATTDRSAYETNLPYAVSDTFTTIAGLADYRLELARGLEATAFASYKRDQPWNATDPSAGPVSYNRRNDRGKVGARLVWDASDEVNLMFGAEAFWDNALALDPENPFTPGSSNVNEFDDAAYVQGTWALGWTNVTVGARYEANTGYGEAFVPRIGVVKEYDRWGYKLLYSEAFRGPTVENVSAAPFGGIGPERTTVAEVELNHRLGESSRLTLNAYSISVTSPIVYYYANNDDVYQNCNRTGSEGIEASFESRASWGSLKAGYSYYKTLMNGVHTYQVPGDGDAFLAFPAHKATAQATWHGMNGRISLTPTIVYASSRYGYDYWTISNHLAPRRFDENWAAHFAINVRDFLTKDLTLTLAAFNLLNQDAPFLQPYNGGHPPVPSESREVMARLQYPFDL